MRLILEYVSGPSRLPKIWLVPGQSATVGRTADADYSADSDRFMSSLHFRIECRDTSCWIRDLGSTNGTFLNNEQVVESALRSGDHLRAGQTVFSIQVEGAENLTTGSVPLSRSVVLELAASLAPGDVPVLSASPAVLSPAVPSPAVPSPAAPSPAVPSPAVAERAAVAAPPWPAESPREPVAVNAAPVEPVPAPSGGWPLTQTVPLIGLPTSRIELLCLEVVSGQPVQKVWLPPGKTLTVGRSRSADFCLPEDPTVSGMHFQLSCGYQECRVKDLDSTAGTLLNGRRVRDAMVRHGNVITAGRTELKVDIRYDRSDGHTLPPTASFTPVPTPSGMFVYQGSDPRLTWLDMMRLLSQLFPMYLVGKISAPPTAIPAGPTYLIDWLSLPVARRLSPIVLPVSQFADVQALVESHWKQDKFVCVFSRLELSPLLARLRLATRGQSYAAETPVPEHLLGEWRPSHLALTLASSTPTFAGAVMSGVDALLVEPQQSDQWEILGDEFFADVLELLGLSHRTGSLSG